MTTTPSDEELLELGYKTWLASLPLGMPGCCPTAEAAQAAAYAANRAIYDAGLAAGRAERAGYDVWMNAAKELGAKVDAAEQKLAALVDGLRVITLHVAQYGSGTMPARPVNQRLTALMSAAPRSAAPVARCGATHRLDFENCPNCGDPTVSPEGEER